MQGGICSTQAREKVQDKNTHIHAKGLILYASMDSNKSRSEVATPDLDPKPEMDP